MCWLHPEMNLLVLLFSPCQYGWTKALDLSRDEPIIRYEIEKCGYISVVFAKHPPMFKLEWDSIEVNCKRIQLENSFWGEGCVYLCLWFIWVFIALVFIVWMNAFMRYRAVGINDYRAVGINDYLLLSTNSYSSINLVRYSLALLGIECLLWLRPSLMFVRYALHWIAFNLSIERWTILTLISNECGGVIDFNSLFARWFVDYAFAYLAR